jgi:predicted peptidase
MKKILLISVVLFLSNLFAQADSTRQIPGKMEKEITVTVSLNYLVYLPPAYEKDNKEWPLVLFLHGSGERGEDLNFVKRLGPPMLVEQGKDFPFILISPQCQLGRRWDPLALTTLLDEVEKNYRIDKNRVYVTGLSMGGEGTWKLAFAEPYLFAAIAPVCGRTGSYYLDACDIKNLPIWVFHGAKDDVVSISESERIVKALKECGSDVRFTVYPEANHNAWTETYNNDELYNWLLEHHLDKSK